MNTVGRTLAIAILATLASAQVASAEQTKVWVERSYEQQVSLGQDPTTGKDMYPHQSVAIQYAVNCASGTLSMVAWNMFSGPHGDGALVWAGQHATHAGASGYAAGTDEERGALANACQSTAAAR